MRTPSFPRWLAGALIVILLALLIGGGWLYFSQKQHLRQEAEDDLQAIARSKIDQILAWRSERMGDATVLMSNPLEVEDMQRWLADGQPEQAGTILALFRAMQENYQYYDVLLVDAEGQVRLSLLEDVAELPADTRRTLDSAWRNRQPELTDLQAGSDTLPPHIDVIAPLFTADAKRVGAVILQNDANQFLYPLIQSWPTSSESAETLIVRRDGDSVLFLNTLRYQPGAAFTLRIPLTETDVPAVKAVLGTEGIVQGQDYRGVEVASDLHAIPDSSWYMIAKIDTNEIFADWRTRSVLILALIVGAVVAVGIVGGMVWQRYQKVQYRTLFEAEKAQQASMARYHTMLLSIGDGVIVTDATGHIELINPAAAALTGWAQDEAQGQPLETVFHIVNEDTHVPAENPVRQILRSGIVIGLANHTLLICRDGREIPIADSGAPIHDPLGAMLGVVLVFRDQIEERAAQAALQAEKERFRLAAESLSDVIFQWDLKKRLDWFGAVDDLLGYAPGEFPRTLDAWRDRLHPDERANLWQVVQGWLAGSDQSAVEHRIQKATGEWRWLLARGTAVRNDSGEPTHLIGSITDITERKQAEEALYESERLARSTLNGLSAHIAILDEVGTILAVNSRWRAFAKANPPVAGNVCEGANYLAVCDQAGGPSAEGAAEFAAAIRAILRGDQDHFELEYSCHSPTEQRWFVGRVTRFPGDGPPKVVVAHENNTPLKLAELKLAGERNLLRTLIDNLPDRIYAKDAAGHFMLKNQVDLRNMGAHCVDEVLGKTDFDYYSQALAAQYHADDQAVIQSGQPLINREEPFVTPEGKQGWMLTSKVPLHSDQGEVIGLVGIGRDITERKQAEEALRQSTEQLSRLYQAGKQLGDTLELETIYNTVSEAVAQVMVYDSLIISSYTPEDQLIRCIFALHDGARLDVNEFPPIPLETEGRGTQSLVIRSRESLYLADYQAHMKTAETAYYVDKEEGIIDREVTDDEDVIRSGLIAPLMYQGHVIGVIQVLSYRLSAYSQDALLFLDALTPQIAAAMINARLYEELDSYNKHLWQAVEERTEQLRQAKDRIEAILNSNDDIIVLCRTDGTISQVNPAFEVSFKCSSQDALFKPLVNMVIDEHKPLLTGAFQTVVSTRQPSRLELTVQCHDQQPFDTDVVLSPIIDQFNEFLGVVCSLRDITRRKQMEAQLRQMLEHEMELGELKSRYVSMAAHDLRNPLAVVQSAVDIIRHYNEKLTEEQRLNKLDAIQDSITVMVEMLNDILTIGSVESGKLSFEPAPLDVVAFCQSITRDIKQTAGSVQIEFIGPDKCGKQYLDARLLRHILGNLLSNAVKYSVNHDRVTFSLDCNSEWITFRVQDRGIGIPAEDQPHLFETFRRATNVGGIPGTGLGLAIVKQSVEIHGGTVAFESAEGQGTTFIVTIPHLPAPDAN